jgi:hypothetical protein
LKELKDPPHIILEPLGKFWNILVRKEFFEIRCLGWKTPEDLDFGLCFEDPRNLVTCQKHGDFAIGRDNPLGKLALSMWV